MSRTIKITPNQKLSGFFSELWEYRELFYAFAWRDLKVRYAQTSLGVLWAFVQPVFTILILWVVFGRFIKIDMGGVPPLAFVASGVSCWTYFSFVSTNSGQSIIQAQQMIKKIYFPKIVLPISKAILGLIDLAVAQLVMFAILLMSDVEFTSRLLFVPLILVALMMISLGLGIWVSALTIRFRDIQQIVPFMIQLGLYITPVAYPAAFAQNYLPKWAVVFYYANPMAGIIDCLRYCLFGTEVLSSYSLYSIGAGIILFFTSIAFFQYSQRKIADVI